MPNFHWWQAKAGLASKKAYPFFFAAKTGLFHSAVCGLSCKESVNLATSNKQIFAFFQVSDIDSRWCHLSSMVDVESDPWENEIWFFLSIFLWFGCLQPLKMAGVCTKMTRELVSRLKHGTGCTATRQKKGCFQILDLGCFFSKGLSIDVCFNGECMMLGNP